MIRIELRDTKRISHFDWQWPEGEPEQFGEGWDATAVTTDRSFRIRLGLGSRNVYGKRRAHVVVWVNGAPTVEGTGTDDHSTSRSLVSLLKRNDGKNARSVGEVDSEYRGLEIVQHSEVIKAPYSRRALAVRIREDNLESWVLHAVVRFLAKERRTSRSLPSPRDKKAIVKRSPSHEPPRTTDSRALVQELLTFGVREAQRGEDGKPVFTGDSRANALVLENPFGFLLAVIFDQGIPAERAWAAPDLLRRRVGHLDPSRLMTNTESVHSAVTQQPALHRFVNKVSEWVVDAARRVVQEYGGDAGRIWNGNPRVQDVHERLREFKGIDQKKAAMAVEILARDLDVPFQELQSTEPAYDVHIRRVFLRTGLADRDDLESIRQAARKAHPERPGQLPRRQVHFPISDNYTSPSG